jgi:CMP-N-acetylneuraminic acid synthetase
MINNGIKLKAIDVSNFSVIEIDTPQDLRLAQQMIGI